MAGKDTGVRSFRPGDRLAASDMNAIVGALGDLRKRIDEGDSEMVARLVAAALAALGADWLLPVKISAVHVTGTPIGGASLPSEVKYSYVAFYRPNLIKEQQTPVYGRPVKNDEARIYPATRGMVAVVVKNLNGDGTPRPELMLLPGSEVVARRTCGG